MAHPRTILPRRAGRALVAAALLLAACRGEAPTGPGPGPGAKASARPSAGATAAATAAPGTPGPTGTATPAAAPVLARAQAGSVALAGVVRLDAAYAVKVGAGRVISNHGAAAVAFADAGLIANNSGNVIANNAAGVIANNAGNIISDKGSGIISDKGSGYVLAQAAGTPQVGEIMPAAGMLVGAVDLRSGALVAVGADAAGNPIQGVYTDAAGAYTLHLPPAIAGNVAVVAVPPGLKAPDPRLALGLVTAPRGTDATLDEDTALVSRFMRAFLTGNVAEALAVKDPETLVKTGAVSEAMRAVTKAFFTEINGIAAASGLRDAGPAEVEKVAARVSDVVLSTVSLPEVMISSEIAAGWTRPPAPAVPTMVAIMKETRERATDALRRDPAFFAGQGWFQAVEARKPGVYAIARPADLGDLIVREFLVANEDPARNMDLVFGSLGMGAVRPQGGNERRVEIEAGALAIGGAIVGALLANKDGGYDAGIAAVKAWKKP